jgi:hypothetical protein
MGPRDKHQYGGTKTSILENKGESTERWVPTADPERISIGILTNICSLQVVSSSSLCSMVLVGRLDPDGDIQIRSQIYRSDGTLATPTERANRARNVKEGKLDSYVCMKISLIRKHMNPSSMKILWKEPASTVGGSEVVISKEVESEDDVEREAASQRNVALQMLCGENASDIIPDILASCYLKHDSFSNIFARISSKSKKYSAELDDKTVKVLNWIKTNARQYDLIIHIAFMDYIEGFVTVRDFFNSNPDPAKQLAVSYEAAAVILLLLLKARIMSWDFHSRNLLTNGIDGKGLDLGRIYNFGLSKDRDTINDYVSSTFITNRGDPGLQALFHFFNITERISTKTPQEPDLNRFSDDYKRILVDLPDRAYEFPGFSVEGKRKSVYEALMMIAFIDGITNDCEYKSNSIQVSHILRRVFHDAPDFTTRDTGLFSNFGKFLNRFTIDYDVFVTQQAGNGTVVADMNKALDEICRRLEPKLVPCSISKRQNAASFKLPDDPSYDSEEEEKDVDQDEQPSTLINYFTDYSKAMKLLDRTHEEVPSVYDRGGSNRRRRRDKSNKKRKYKSRKIRSRRKRKITRKRCHNIR